MFVEFWIGNRDIPRYSIRDPKEISLSMGGTFVRIVSKEGNVFETSPTNILIISDLGEECERDERK